LQQHRHARTQLSPCNNIAMQELSFLIATTRTGIVPLTVNDSFSVLSSSTRSFSFVTGPLMNEMNLPKVAPRHEMQTSVCPYNSSKNKQGKDNANTHQRQLSNRDESSEEPRSTCKQNGGMQSYVCVVLHLCITLVFFLSFLVHRKPTFHHSLLLLKDFEDTPQTRTTYDAQHNAYDCVGNEHGATDKG